MPTKKELIAALSDDELDQKLEELREQVAAHSLEKAERAVARVRAPAPVPPSATTDREDPRLREADEDGMHKAHLVLSEEERAKGFVRPVRSSYIHVGPPPACGKPETRGDGTALYCTMARGHTGRCVVHMDEEHFQKRQAPRCHGTTTTSPVIAETYARDPSFYGQTWCSGCRGYYPVGEDHGEFIWTGTNERVGT